jgi:hypothetical protein
MHIEGTAVERVESFKILSIHITDKLKWSTLLQPPKTLTNFYRYTIESILSGCITAWYDNCSAHNCKALQRVVRSAQRITRDKLPALQDTYCTRFHRNTKKIIKDNNHPSRCLFTPLRSRR